jgi:hypothetical protein
MKSRLTDNYLVFLVKRMILKSVGRNWFFLLYWFLHLHLYFRKTKLRYSVLPLLVRKYPVVYIIRLYPYISTSFDYYPLAKKDNNFYFIGKAKLPAGPGWLPCLVFWEAFCQNQLLQLLK